MRKLPFILLLFSLPALSQEIARFQTFSNTRVINAHSTETLKKKDLDIRITHRFGNIGGNNGGIHTLYGLDNSTDIRIALEYGLTESIMIGLGRSKGGGPVLSEVFDGFLKYKFTQQTADNSMPVSISFLGSSIITGMEPVNVESSPADFNRFPQRMAYTTQAIIAHHINARASVQLMPTFQHRNKVAFDDDNQLYSLGFASRIKITKVIGLSVEYFYVLNNRGRSINSLQTTNPLAFGFIIDTGGHVFQLSVSNSTSIGENQFIPYTTSSWADGEFRLGFTISRPIAL